MIDPNNLEAATDAELANLNEAVQLELRRRQVPRRLESLFDDFGAAGGAPETLADMAAAIAATRSAGNPG